MRKDLSLRSIERILRQWCIPQVRLDNSKLGEQGLCLLVLDTWVDNDILTRIPVDRRGYAMFVGSLEGVNDAEELSCIATR